MENNAERRQTRAMTEAQRMEEEAGREVVRSFRMDASRNYTGCWMLGYFRKRTIKTPRENVFQVKLNSLFI